MGRQLCTSMAALVAVTALVWLAPVVVAGHTVTSSLVPDAQASAEGVQTETDGWTLPRTPWGAPDMQGIWDYATLTPLQRAIEFGEKEFLTDEEVAALEQRKAERADGRPIWSSSAAPTVHPPFWLD